MKILIVIGGFFPGKKCGGPPVSVENFCSLMNEYECYIVTVNHDLNETTPYENIESNIWIKRNNYKIMYLNDCDYNKSTFEEVIKSINPDSIYLQGLFQKCIVPCLELAKKYNINLFLAPRGELCKGAFKKKYKKIPYIIALRIFGLIKNIKFQSTSSEENSAIQKYLGAQKERICNLNNIPSLPPRNYNFPIKECGKANLIFISRIHPKKNLLGAIEFLENVSGTVNFDIYGPKEDLEYWDKCENKIKELPDNISVNYKGIVEHSKIHDIFSLYDAFLFPTFSENYGHVIAESLSVGTPVIISNQTPWTDVNENSAGWALELNKTNLFSQAIQKIIDDDSNKYRIAALKYVNKKMELDKIKKEYTEFFENK